MSQWEHDVSYDPRTGEYVILVDPGDGQSMTFTKEELMGFISELIDVETSS